MQPKMWPMQGVGSTYFMNICSLVNIGTVNGLYLTMAYDPEMWHCDNRFMHMPYYLPLHGLCSNASALDSHCPTFVTPGGTYRRAGLATFYPLIMFFALIAIGNQDYGVLYKDIFRKDAHTRQVTIVT